MDNSANAFSDNNSDFLADKSQKSMKKGTPLNEAFSLPPDSLPSGEASRPADDPFQHDAFSPSKLAPLQPIEQKAQPGGIFEPLGSGREIGKATRGAKKPERFDYLAFGLDADESKDKSSDKHADDFDWGAPKEEEPAPRVALEPPKPSAVAPSRREALQQYESPEDKR